MSLPRLYNIKEVAACLRLTKVSDVRELIAEGKLDCITVKGKPLFKVEHIQNFLNNCEKAC